MFFWTLIVIILIDGVKSIIEIFNIKEVDKSTSNFDNITVIMSAYNEADMIENTLSSFIENGFKNILVVDDGSTDDTSDIVRKFSQVTLFTEKNRGKAPALDWLLQKVTTKYVMIVDADIVLSKNFTVPILDDNVTGVAFNIVPLNKPKNIINEVVVALQRHEYAKSMNIGRKSKNKTKSVTCISGAAGIYYTERLKELSKVHSGNFSGEDLQRTLIELLNDGNIIYSDSIIYTDVPQTPKALIKQRIFGWWGGLYHVLPLFFKILFFRKSPVLLRYEMLYEFFSILTDPLKIIFLIGAIITLQWQYLIFLYCIYLIIELIIFLFIQKKYYSNPLIIFLYPFYTLLQMFLRVCGMINWMEKRIKGKWKPLKRNIKVKHLYLLFITTTILSNVNGQNITTAVEYNRFFYSTGKQDNNIQLYTGYKNLYYNGSYISDKRHEVGVYIPKGLVWTRWRKEDTQIYGNYNIFSNKTFISAVNLTYQHIYRIEFDSTSKRNIKIPGIELEHYINDNSNLSLQIKKEFGRRNDLFGLAVYNFKKDKFKSRVGLGINSLGDKNTFIVLEYNNFYIVGSYIERFDYNDYDRSSVGIGYKLKF